MFNTPSPFNSFNNPQTTGLFNTPNTQATTTLGAPSAFSMGPVNATPNLKPPAEGSSYLPNSPEKTPSSLAWSPVGNFIAASSWDNTTRCWQVEGNMPGSISSKFLLSTTLTAPQLTCVWSYDGKKIFTGGCDNKVTCWDLEKNQQIPTNCVHDLPISTIQVVQTDPNTIITGSWDKQLRIWDLRNSAGPSLQVDLKNKIYCSDLKDFTFVVGLSDTSVAHINFANGGLQAANNPTKIQSKLYYPVRCIGLFHDKEGFAAGSIEGRVSIHHFTDDKKSFLFKCHRVDNQIFPVNDISFHPKEGTFSTCGSDGHWNFWDKDAKSRIKPSVKLQSCVPVGKFSKCGTYFAYAEYYDYFKGPGAESNYPNAAISFRLVGSDANKKKKN